MRKSSLTQIVGPVSLAAWLLLAPQGVVRGDEPDCRDSPARRLASPVALAIADGGKTILAANRRSGSISVIDAASRSVVAEHDVGRGLAGLAVLPGRPPSPRRRPSGERSRLAVLSRPFDPGPRESAGRPRPRPPGRLGRRIVLRRGLALVAPADVRRPDAARAGGQTPRALDRREPRIAVLPAGTGRVPRTARSWPSPMPSAAGSRSSTSGAGRSIRSVRCPRTTSAGWPSRPTAGRC